MNLTSIRSVYVRGGTSRALMFRKQDLPSASPPHDTAEWDEIFLRAIGAPDPFARQLDGMGGGISSLSKVAVIGAPTHTDADVDYTFVQVGVHTPNVGYLGSCGNIAAAVGPFALDEGMVKADGREASIRIHNTNTRKIIVAHFPLENGALAPRGDFSIPGVAGTAAPIRLEFVDPSGGATGSLLPTGHVRNTISVPGYPHLEVSMVDAGNPSVFVAARAIGLIGNEAASALAEDAEKIALFEEIRVAAGVHMGLARSEEEARLHMRNLPLVGLVAPSQDGASDIVTRMISSGQPHKAVPLTGAMCLAAAAYVQGTIVNQALSSNHVTGADLRIAHASGVLQVSASVSEENGRSTLKDIAIYRTARRLMEGRVFLRPD